MEEAQRKYQEVWLKILSKGPTDKDNPSPTHIVRVQVRNTELFKRIRKAVWKEKSLDEANREKYRVHCEFIKDKCILEFWISKNLTADMV